MARNIRDKDSNCSLKNDEVEEKKEKKEKNINIKEEKKEKNINKANKKTKSNRIKTVIAIVVIAVALVATVVTVYILKNKDVKAAIIPKKEVEVKDAVKDLEKNLDIFKTQNRIVATMISNEKAAWPQAGLQEAYMIYECIIEGGETRFMAMFKDNMPAKVGPIRSARHYFVNYFEEQDGIYAHFGWSPKAEELIKADGINNVNGIYDTYYFRQGAGYNNAYASMEKIKQFAADKKYSLTSVSKPLYKYSEVPYYLESQDTIYISEIKMKYSNMHSVSYKYDPDRKVFLRSMRNTPHKDKTTGEQIYAKNVVMLYVNHSDLNDYAGSARQEVDNIGSGTGFYATNGRYIPVTWSKTSKKAKTEIKDLAGNDIILNDGLTFMQIVPKEYKIDFTAEQ
ncbi:MAG: DUF3048 domain-containing protein [Clostridia bacterium]